MIFSLSSIPGYDLLLFFLSICVAFVMSYFCSRCCVWIISLGLCACDALLWSWHGFSFILLVKQQHDSFWSVASIYFLFSLIGRFIDDGHPTHFVIIRKLFR